MVLIAVRVHPFPFRTRQLSSSAPKILGWRRPGKIDSANTKRRSKDRRLVLALSIFPGRCQPSIVDRNELNYRVRNGNGWTLILISTNYMSSSAARKQTILYCPSRLLSRHFLSGDPYRIRTDVNGVRGRCLNHLTNGPWCAFTDSNRGPTD